MALGNTRERLPRGDPAERGYLGGMLTARAMRGGGLGEGDAAALPRALGVPGARLG